MMSLFDELRPEYQELWDSMTISLEHLSDVRLRAADILQTHRKNHYEAVQAELNIPWMVIACIHSLESDLSFGCHLHNGDPLTARTVGDPKGCPRTGEPPFSWQDSAIDALKRKLPVRSDTWSIPECLFFFENYNGWGYRSGSGADTTPRHRSPYLWSFSNNYEKGKYVRDRVFDPKAASRQIGAAVLLKMLIEQSGQQPADSTGVNFSSHYDLPILRRGSRGKHVAELQIILRQNSFDPGYADGIFGTNTLEAVRDFQKSRRLDVDGIVGPNTWEMLLASDNIPVAVPAITQLRTDVVTFATAEAQKGRMHAPNNDIDKLVLDPLRPILMKLGHLASHQQNTFFNWCAAWVTWVCRSNGIKIPDQYRNFWASVAKVDAWRDMAMECKAWFRVNEREPLPGDIVVYNWDDDSDMDHIGIVKEYIPKEKKLVTCEGNRNKKEAIVPNQGLSDVAGFIDLDRLNAEL